MDLTNERIKVSLLEGDVAEVEVTTRIELHEPVLAGKLAEAQVKDELDLFRIFL